MSGRVNVDFVVVVPSSTAARPMVVDVRLLVLLATNAAVVSSRDPINVATLLLCVLLVGVRVS